MTQGMRNGAAKGNTKVNIELKASEPFMIVFEEVPQSLTEDTVSSSNGQEASHYPIAQLQPRIST